ncbi:MAG: hypothetical protein ABSF91_05760 [Bacteroidota bacterium]|jgi:hypothetical protein
MKSSSHWIFIFFLVMVGLVATIVLAVRGLDYYRTPFDLRPFRSDYSLMRPSGSYSHGLGVLGALMVIVGVAMYSARKRMVSLGNIGRLSKWLEVHIFLCLLGPVLIVYHTTFKAGGIAAISLWTMLSVVASGVIGRFLYVLIPRNLNGNELTVAEIDGQIHSIGSVLRSSPVGLLVGAMVDKSFSSVERPETLGQTVFTIIRLQRLKAQTRGGVCQIIAQNDVPREVAKQLEEAASSKAAMLQKSLVLTQVERMFFYWHAIHLPFTVIMFVTLAAHVTVVMLLGYKWVF